MKKLFRPLFIRLNVAYKILTTYDNFYLVGKRNINEAGDIEVHEVQFKMKKQYSIFLTEIWCDKINSDMVEEINLD